MNGAELFGRARELSELVGLLADGTNRLVTLTGTAGVGKTRLADAAVERLGPDRSVVRVALADAATSADVPKAVARAFELPDLAPNDVLAAVADAAHGRLLVLDNLEHLLAAGSWITSLLAASSGLQVLTTSRVALRIAPEHVLELAPLDASSGAQLLRARAAERGHSLDDDAAAAVSAAVDHLPLAIELAAARLAVLTEAELLDRLQRGTKVVGAGLERSLQSSHDLLSAAAATLLRRMAVFAGSPSLVAIETVCVSPDGLAVVGDDLLDALTELLEANLVSRADRGDEARFGWLRVVREFAATQLDRAGEAETLAAAHAAWACATARDARRLLPSERQADGLDRFDVERDELLAATRWSLDREVPPAAAAELVGLQRFFWLLRGQVHTGGACAELLLERAGEIDPASRSMAAAVAGDAATARGDLATALDWATAAVAAAEAVEDNLGLHAEALTGLARAARNRGDEQTAADALRRVVPIADAMGVARNSSTARANLAGGLARIGEVNEALALLRRVLADSDNGLTPLDEVITLGTLADVALIAHDDATVVDTCDRGIVIAESVGDPVGVLELTNTRSQARRRLGDVDAALADAEAALRLAVELDEARGRAHALVNRAAAMALRARPASAVHALADALRAAEHDPAALDPMAIAIDVAATGIGLLPDDVVATLLATRDEPVDDVGAERRRQKAKRQVEARLSRQRLAAALERGRMLDAMQIVDLALRSAEAVPVDATPDDRGGLTPRELDVVRLVARGMTDKEIAAALGCAPRTITTHVGHVLTKLGVSTRTAAAARAAGLDLL